MGAKTGPKGPWKYKKSFHPKEFVRLSRDGKSLAEIAADWDVRRETLYAWAKEYPEFSNALSQGKQLCEAWYIRIGKEAVTGLADHQGKKVQVNYKFYQWMTQNICKWSANTQVSQPTPVVERDQEDDEKLKKLNQMEDIKRK